MLINGILITLSILLATKELIGLTDSGFYRRLNTLLIVLIVPLLSFFILIVLITTINILK
jgi:hypothetical protein